MSRAKIRLRKVTSHYAIDGTETRLGDLLPDKRLSDDAKKFWNECAFRDACGAGVVATFGGEVVGFCRYESHRLQSGGHFLGFQGTWVAPAFRKQGLAVRMWKLVLKDIPEDAMIDAIAMSAEGYQLLNALARLYPKMRWSVHVSDEVKNQYPAGI